MLKQLSHQCTVINKQPWVQFADVPRTGCMIDPHTNTANQLAQSRVHRTSMWEVAGWNPGWINSQAVLNNWGESTSFVTTPLYICKWLDFQAFSDKDDKPEVLSHSPCSLILWDIKDPTCYLKRVGHRVPGVVVWPFLHVVSLEELAWRASLWMRPQLCVTGTSQAT